MKGISIHVACGGTGIISMDDKGNVEVCIGCMGSGMEELDFEMGDHPNWIK